MKLPFSWLKKYIDVKIAPQKLAQMLTSAGLEVTEIIKKGGEQVFEIEVTSNRPDLLSILGVAREAAAVCDIKSINIPKALPLKAKASITKPFSIDIIDKKACPRYIGRLIKDVTIEESPKWMKTAIESLGSRTINNGADITNYCLYETGQPMHAFDFDKLHGGKIIVRRAKKGESIVTIDGVKRDLDESILIIADEKRPVAIAGIMGGVDTEISNTTKNILLESAFFDPVIIRRASRKLGLSTESNYRFERRVDTENVLFASCRAAYLYKEICSGDVNEPFLDVNYIKSGTRAIELTIGNFERLIGLRISASRIKTILQSLGFTVKPGKGKDSFIITVPSFRNDVSLEEDLIEEIARVEGFEKIENALPQVKAHVDAAISDEYAGKKKMRRLLLALGLDEVVTYSLLSSKNLDDARINAQKRLLVMNPLSIEQEVLRTSLLPSLLKVINTNLNRALKNIKIFEMGKIYEKTTKKLTETDFLGVALCGSVLGNWKDTARKVTFYDLKGIIEYLLEDFKLQGRKIERKNFDYFSTGESAIITAGGLSVAELGKINKTVLKNYDISEDVYFAQINIPVFLNAEKSICRYQPLAKYPSVERDIALVVKKEVSAQSALDIIKEIGGALVVKSELFDVYSGDQIPEDCRSLAFSIEYQSSESTLTEEEVSGVHNQIKETLVSRLNGKLR